KPARDDRGVRGPAPERSDRRQAERRGSVVVIDEDFDRRAEREPGGAAADAGGLRVADGTGAVADGDLEHRRSGARHAGPCLRRRNVGKRERGAVEARGEGRRVGLGGETEQDEELRAGHELAIRGTEDLDELRARVLEETRVGRPPEGIDQVDRLEERGGGLWLGRATRGGLVDGPANVDAAKRAEPAARPLRVTARARALDPR